MKKTVYIETTIPSFYYEDRQLAKMHSWRESTRKWWDVYRQFYQPVSSSFVIMELQRRKHPYQAEKIALLDSIELLDHLPIIDEIVQKYIENKLVSEEYGGDAYHLAYASYYGIEFLLTWNCSHLANPNKFHHMRVINTKLDLNMPILCTPEQLLSSDGEVNDEI
jgi:predicted nucleic acid-binding protein